MLTKHSIVETWLNGRCQVTGQIDDPNELFSGHFKTFCDVQYFSSLFAEIMTKTLRQLTGSYSGAHIYRS